MRRREGCRKPGELGPLQVCVSRWRTQGAAFYRGRDLLKIIQLGERARVRGTRARVRVLRGLNLAMFASLC